MMKEDVSTVNDALYILLSHITNWMMKEDVSTVNDALYILMMKEDVSTVNDPT